MSESFGNISESRWRNFWNRGSWWKAVLFSVVYYVLYLTLPLLAKPFLTDVIDSDNLLSSSQSVFAAVIFPLILAAVMLVAFSISVGWWPRPLFSRQPVSRSAWMWLAPIIVLIPITLRAFGTDYEQYSVSVIVTVFAAGACVGFVEELLTRGLVVTMLRKAGHKEFIVALLSSLIFALLHAGNLLTGQTLAQVGPTVLYTFAFGGLMYLTLRVTGNLIWPMILHGLTDPTTMLAAGGVDEQTIENQSALMAAVGPATVLLIVSGVVLLLFVRGRAQGVDTGPNLSNDVKI
ncbi:CPBP family intramembrane glutamic endopeptidase [Timonella sp. A28]|uniref:CPBP family intramembrane glutamic endopeptidase n=1 Tax=Timonella sp. A28 TaxID=3442640 RepID=UPI003EBAABF7